MKNWGATIWAPLSRGCLGGHKNKKKIFSVIGHFEGRRSGSKFVPGEGEFAGEEKRGAYVGIIERKEVYSVGLIISFDYAFRGSPVKPGKGWWIPEDPLAYTQVVVSRCSNNKELVICYCPLKSLLLTETAFGFVPQNTLLWPQLRKSSRKSCVYNLLQKPLWPWIFPSSSDVAGDAFFQMLMLRRFQTEPF